MVGRRSILFALVALAIAGCAGAGSRSMPPSPAAIQPQSARTVPESAVRTTSARRLATPVPLATGLLDPTSLALHGPDVFIGDTTVSSVPRTGGPLRTVLTGTSFFDYGSNRGVNAIAFAAPDTIVVGFGGYAYYAITAAPIATGVQTQLTSVQAGFLVDVFGPNVYYGYGFCCIKWLPVVGGATQTFNAHIWLRSTATDAASIFFVDYWTRNVERFDVATHTLTQVITGNAVEGKIVIDRTHVYHQQGAAIQKVSKQGGPITVIYTGTEPQVLAVDNDDVFFTDGPDLKAVPIRGGPARTLVSGVRVLAAAADKKYLYFSDDSRGAGSSVVYRIRTGPSGPRRESGDESPEDD